MLRSYLSTLLTLFFCSKEEMKLELEKNHRVTVLKNNVWQVDADELIISLVVCAGGGPSTALTSSNDVDRLQMLNNFLYGEKICF